MQGVEIENHHNQTEREGGTVEDDVQKKGHGNARFCFFGLLAPSHALSSAPRLVFRPV